MNSIVNFHQINVIVLSKCIDDVVDINMQRFLKGLIGISRAPLIFRSMRSTNLATTFIPIIEQAHNYRLADSLFKW